MESFTAVPVHSSTSQKQPKRKSSHKGAKKGEPLPGTPIFLRKTWEMINTSDPSIASWWDNGKTFVIKDPDRFAAEVVPEYFKHNNFSSFVRQLNFYGFRKIKSDAIRLKDAEDCEESNWPKFKHNLFQKGRPELLIGIKKTNHSNNDSAEKQEIEELKKEVSELKQSLAWVTDDLMKLKTLVVPLLKNQQLQQENEFLPNNHQLQQEESEFLSNTMSGIACKKRKIADFAAPMPVLSEISVPQPEPTAQASLSSLPVGQPDPDPAAAAAADVGIGEKHEQPSVSAMPPPPPVRISERNESTATATLDQDVLASIFALDPSDELSVFDGRAPSSNLMDIDVSIPEIDNNVDEELIERVRGALAKLPPDMQVMFVDRIAAVIGDPEGLAKQVEAMTELAAASASEAQRRLMAAGHGPDDKHFLPLASAVLGAYLQRYLEQTAPPSISCLPGSTAYDAEGRETFPDQSTTSAAVSGLPMTQI